MSKNTTLCLLKRKTLTHFLLLTCDKIKSGDFCRDFSVRFRLDFGMLHPATCLAINKTRIYGRPQNWEGLQNDSIMHVTRNWNCLYRRTAENLQHLLILWKCLDIHSFKQGSIFWVNKLVTDLIIIQVPVDLNRFWISREEVGCVGKSQIFLF